MKTGVISAGVVGVFLLAVVLMVSGGTGAERTSTIENTVDALPSFVDESDTTFTRDDNPTETRAYTEYGDVDKDCSDFATHREAQAYFIAKGGPSSDRDNLDRDGDGSACDTLR